MFLGKIFRNKTADILLVVGLTLSCILLVNVSGLISKIIIEDASVRAFEYEWYGGLTFSDEYSNQRLIEVFENIEEGNIYQSVLLNVEKDSDETPALTVMKANEDLRLEYIEGGYDASKEYKNAVIIGETLKKKTYIKDSERYIQCNDIEFNVVGIVKNKMSGSIDNSFYILWDSLDDFVREEFLMGEIMMSTSFYIKSDEKSVIDNVLNAVDKTVCDDGSQLVPLDIEDWDYENYWYKSYNKVLFGIALIFSVITCFSVSYFWLVKRKSELAIRIAFGYSRLQIFGQLLFDLFKLLIHSFVITVVIQCVYSLVDQNNIIVLETLLLQVFVICVGMLAIVLLNVFYMMKKIKTMDLSMRA